jgi:hypothetical protein
MKVLKSLHKVNVLSGLRDTLYGNTSTSPRKADDNGRFLHVQLRMNYPKCISAGAEVVREKDQNYTEA